MGTTYSASEARVQFAEVLRQVREGNTVTVSYRGEPVAEIRPIPTESGATEKAPETLEERLVDMERRGVLIRPREPRRPFRPGAYKPGVLKRFLAERHG